MLTIRRPAVDEIARLQQRDGAYYWSGCIETVLGKYDGRGGECVEIVTRSGGVGAAGGRAIVEGPIDESVLDGFGVRASLWQARVVTLVDERGGVVGDIGYPTFSVKAIASKRGERTLARRCVPDDVWWRSGPMRLQVFEEIPAGARVVLRVRTSDGDRPVGLLVGRQLLLGVPMFDVLAFGHAMPGLSEGFYQHVLSPNMLEVERWVMDRVLELAGSDLSLRDVCPRAMLTVRHDYDRPISDEQLSEMLGLYGELGVRATWFLLCGEKAPPEGQAAAMIEGGHEIALHSIASSCEQMKEEVEEFRSRYGVRPSGYSSHGGIGSRGHLAATQNRWAEALGLEYGEFIGRSRGWAHAMIDVIDGKPAARGLVMQNEHYSLDLSTKADGHQLAELERAIPQAFGRAEHVIIMNHPDIHRAELCALLRGLDLRQVEHLTLQQAACRARERRYAQESPEAP